MNVKEHLQNLHQEKQKLEQELKKFYKNPFKHSFISLNMVQEEDLILGTVDRITPTTVFVKLPNNKEGTIITSEIAPGRIKNIRQYVAPNKKIVCKVLRVRGDHIDLSLRRVTSKEKKEILEKHKQEQQIKSALKQILKEEFEKIAEKILSDFASLSEFAEKARTDEKTIEKYFSKDQKENIKKILAKKQKIISVKKIIHLKCMENDGIKRLKEIFANENKKVKITYITAGKFQITLEGEDYKKANQELESLIEKIENSSKKHTCEFEVFEK